MLFTVGGDGGRANPPLCHSRCRDPQGRMVVTSSRWLRGRVLRMHETIPTRLFRAGPLCRQIGAAAGRSSSSSVRERGRCKHGVPTYVRPWQPLNGQVLRTRTRRGTFPYCHDARYSTFPYGGEVFCTRTRAKRTPASHLRSCTPHSAKRTSKLECTQARAPAPERVETNRSTGERLTKRNQCVFIRPSRILHCVCIGSTASI